MESVMLIDENQNQFNAELVRYFNVDRNTYLVYTLKEKDENGYVKLYATKIVNSFVAEKIEDEEEWTKFKDLIRVIVHESKLGLVESIEDLNPANLKDVKVESFRLFKLAEVVVELFGSNKKEFQLEQPVVEEPVGSLDDLLGKEQPSYTPLYDEPAQEEEHEEVEQPVVEQVVPTNDFEMPRVEQTFELPQEEEFEMPIHQQPVFEPLYEEEHHEEVEQPVFEPLYEEEHHEEVEQPEEHEEVEQPEEHEEVEQPEEHEEVEQPEEHEEVEQPEEHHEEVQNEEPAVDYEKLYLEEKSKNEELLLRIEKIKELL